MPRDVQKVVVTGGSGRAGRAVIADLREHGYDVTNVDVAPPAERMGRFLSADLTDYGQAVDVLRHADAVVHLAAVPSPGRRTEEQTFRTNVTSTYNVFAAAVLLKLRRVVWSSTEMTHGLPFGDGAGRDLPKCLPIDESHFPYPQQSYSLSKVLGEQMAEQFARWSGVGFVSLRFSNVLGEKEYREDFPRHWERPKWRMGNCWAYVDERDTAASCRLALTADVIGHEALIIAAADTCMKRPTADLIAECFPHLTLPAGRGTHQTVWSLEKAKRVIGYEPKHSWRDAW